MCLVGRVQKFPVRALVRAPRPQAGGNTAWIELPAAAEATRFVNRFRLVSHSSCYMVNRNFRRDLLVQLEPDVKRGPRVLPPKSEGMAVKKPIPFGKYYLLERINVG